MSSFFFLLARNSEVSNQGRGGARGRFGTAHIKAKRLRFAGDRNTLGVPLITIGRPFGSLRWFLPLAYGIQNPVLRGHVVRVVYASWRKTCKLLAQFAGVQILYYNEKRKNIPKFQKNKKFFDFFCVNA